jgi:1-acyl-sn-glycerol-3-phosphate acyltransferase
MLRKIGMIPVDRKNPQRAKASLARAAELIRGRAGYSLAVLPEGTRTPDGRLGPFKRGGFLLALESGLEILPAVQVGAYRINRKGSRLIRPGRVDMFFEPPVSAAGYTRETAGDLMDCVRRVFLRRVA